MSGRKSRWLLFYASGPKELALDLLAAAEAERPRRVYEMRSWMLK